LKERNRPSYEGVIEVLSQSLFIVLFESAQPTTTNIQTFRMLDPCGTGHVEAGSVKSFFKSAGRLISDDEAHAFVDAIDR
jgi:hypothetical protein